MFNKHGDLVALPRRKTPPNARRIIWTVYFLVLTIFALLSIGNELLDIPHYLFGDQATSFEQRKGEVIFEILSYLTVLGGGFWYMQKTMRSRIKILEGFIPICANCKKIRRNVDWSRLEEYISQNSLATFSHTICPDCVRTLYPDYADKLLKHEPHLEASRKSVTR